MGGYIKQFSSVAGDTINAELFNTEYQLIQDGFTSHKHDGSSPTDGGYVPLIADSNILNSIEIDAVNNKIGINISSAGVKTPQLTISNDLIVPINDNLLDIGTSTKGIKDIHVSGSVVTAGLTIGSGSVVNILDEDDMNSNADNVLVTQQSVKAFVENTVSVLPGLFTQSKYNDRVTDFALGGGMADYLPVPITVQENSFVHIHSFIEASGSNTAGTVFASIWRDGTLLTPEEFVVAESSSANFKGSTSNIFVDGPLTAGTYTYIIKLREQATDGIATQAALLLLEEGA